MVTIIKKHKIRPGRAFYSSEPIHTTTFIYHLENYRSGGQISLFSLHLYVHIPYTAPPFLHIKSSYISATAFIHFYSFIISISCAISVSVIFVLCIISCFFTNSSAQYNPMPRFSPFVVYPRCCISASSGLFL